MVYSQNGILSSNKRYELLIYGLSWMNLKNSVSNKKEDRNERVYVICSILYMALEQTRLIMALEIRIMLTTILSGID